MSPEMLWVAVRALKQLPAITATLPGVRCKGIELHSAHHRFTLWGKRCHLQMNCYLAGVKGSGFAMRIPLPDKFCPAPKTSVKSSLRKSGLPAPSGKLTSEPRAMSSFTLVAPRPSGWDKPRLLPTLSQPKYRLVSDDLKRPPRPQVTATTTKPGPRLQKRHGR
jgi:hypothetical protein